METVNTLVPTPSATLAAPVTLAINWTAMDSIAQVTITVFGLYLSYPSPNILHPSIIIDVNECLTNNGGCEHNCTNTDGNFSCSCNTGYSRDSNNLNCTGKIESLHRVTIIPDHYRN